MNDFETCPVGARQELERMRIALAEIIQAGDALAQDCEESAQEFDRQMCGEAIAKEIRGLISAWKDTVKPYREE